MAMDLCPGNSISAIGAISYQPGASPQGCNAHTNRGPKARPIEPPDL